jgi:hypothetical protein
MSAHSHSLLPLVYPHNIAKCADESEAYEIERIEWVMASASSRGDEY